MENLKSKNLGFFMNYFSSLKNWDDSGIFSREIASYIKLSEEFNHIYIFSYGRENDLKFQKQLPKNITIVQKKLPLPDALYEFLLPFIEWKSIKKCDILKTNQNSGAIAPAIAKLLLRKKLIVRSGYIGSLNAELYHYPFYAKAYYWLAESLSYRVCDKAFATTMDNCKILLKKYPFLKNKLIEMNNFIDTDLFKKIEIPKSYDVIYVARLNKDKYHTAILEAAKDMEWRILFIGQGGEKLMIEEIAKKYNINLSIIDRVSNSQLPEYYNASKICAFPSLHEGNPKALLEAMSCELPVVAFSVLGVANLIKNRETGLISAISSQEMKTNISILLNDQSLSDSIGKNSRKFILDNFCFSTLIKKEINIYNELFK